MLKRLAFIVAILFLPALARADSFVSVVLSPIQLGGNPADTMGAAFIWDTTTAQLSDFTVTTTGPDFSFVPAGYAVQGQSIKELDFFSAKNNELFRLEYVDDYFHLYYSLVFGNNPPPILSSTPGTYFTYNEAEGFLTGFDINNQVGSATVTSLGGGDHDGDDPVSTPEPGSLLLLGLGITALAAATYVKNGPA